MKDILFLVGAFVLWFGLIRWVLPWLGIPTCMSGNCRTTCCSSWDSAPSQHRDASPRQSEDAPKTVSDEK